MSRVEEIEKIIEENGFFKGLAPAARKALAAISLHKELKKNEQLFYEGQKASGFFLLVSGAVQVSKTAPDGKEAVIKVIRPGELFGEVVLFERVDYPARAQAVLPSSLLILPKKQIDCLLVQPGFRASFIGFLMNKLRYLTERIVFLTLHDVEERFFLFLREHYGSARSYQVDLSKKDLAQAIGTNPETLSRLAARLVGEKVITWEGRKITILRDPAGEREKP